MPESKPKWMLTEKEKQDIWVKGEGTLSAICQAQARNLVEWLEDRCHHAVYRKFCPICWDELRKEAGL